jgi:magnesium transporter
MDEEKNGQGAAYNQDEILDNDAQLNDKSSSLKNHFPGNDDLTTETVEDYLVSDEEIHLIVDAIDKRDTDALRELVSNFSAADFADLFAKINETDRESIIKHYGFLLPADMFPELDPDLRRMALSEMTANQVAALIDDMDTDDAIYMIEPLDPQFQKEIILKLSTHSRLTLEEGLSYPEKSAGRLMQREFVAIPQFWTVGKTIDYLRAASESLPDEFFDIFVITPTYKIVGSIPLSSIIRAQRPEKLESLTLDETIPIPATLNQEEVARIFRREDLISAPVIDTDQRLIGVITIDDIVDVIDEEAAEDFLKLGGVDKSDVYRAVFQTAQARSYWLLLNCFTAALAAFVISLFGGSIEKIVALAILMPIVASMGGNAGMQALTVAVRAISMREISGTNGMRFIFKEALVGLLNGMAFALIIGAFAALFFSNIHLGFVIAAAMTINLFVAGACGAAIPILLNRMGTDPAVSSAVFLTAITDIIGFMAFLGLATIFLL